MGLGYFGHVDRNTNIGGDLYKVELEKIIHPEIIDVSDKNVEVCLYCWYLV